MTRATPLSAAIRSNWQVQQLFPGNGFAPVKLVTTYPVASSRTCLIEWLFFLSFLRFGIVRLNGGDGHFRSNPTLFGSKPGFRFSMSCGDWS
jgi:hypothetical protein